MGRDLVCVMSNESDVREATPDLDKVASLDGLLLHLTAPGSTFDCVTRSFAPKLKVTEDQVCGSGHCHVIPLWVRKTKMPSLIAYQASARGGVLYCRMAQDRVILAGKAALYAKSEIYVPAEDE